jgi:hypothetical protein
VTTNIITSQENFTYIPPANQLPALASLATCSNNYNSATSCFGNVIYTSNTIISNNIVVSGNVVVNSGVILTTNGFYIAIGGTFSNSGTIFTGNAMNGGTAGSGSSGKGGASAYGLYLQANKIIAGVIAANGIKGTSDASYGGGGGGGGGIIILAYGSGGYTAGTYNTLGGAKGSTGSSNSSLVVQGGNGGNTIVAGGIGATSSPEAVATAGALPNPPTMTNANIILWSGNFINYLSGGGGGGGAGSTSYANGIQGGNFINSYGASGGGGGEGAYSDSITAAVGGNGNVITYNYASQPIATPSQYVYGITENQGAGTSYFSLTLSVSMTDISNAITLKAPDWGAGKGVFSCVF